MAEKALNAGKPLIVGKIGQPNPVAVRSPRIPPHSRVLPPPIAPIFERYGVIEGRDFDEMLDLAVGFLACGDRMPAGTASAFARHPGAPASGWPTPARPPGSMCHCSTMRRARRSTFICPLTARRRIPVDSTAQGVQKLGYAEFARLVARSPVIDSVVVVITARRSAFLEHDLQKLKDLAREGTKPVFMWTYTLPSERSIEILNEAGHPLFTGAHGCARTMRALADYRALRERLPRPSRDRDDSDGSPRENGAAALAKSPSVLCEYRARALLSAYGIGVKTRANSCTRATRPSLPRNRSHGPVALKVQSADIPHKTEAGAVVLNLAGADIVRAAYERVLSAAKRYSPGAQIDGVLVQPMAPPGREVILGVNRDPTWGLLLMVGLGGVLVEAIGDVTLAPVPLDDDRARARSLAASRVRRLFGRYPRHAGGGHRGARRSHGPVIAVLRPTMPTTSMRSISTRSSCMRREKAYPWWTR